DDEWLPHHTKYLQQIVLDERSADLYTLSYSMVNDGKKRSPKVALPDAYTGIVENFISVYSNGYGIIHSSTVCFKKEFFIKTGGFPEGEVSGEDIYLWLISALNGTIAFSHSRTVIVHKNEILSKVRRTESIPYHINFFCAKLHTLDTNQQKEIKRFILKNIVIHWAAAKAEKNTWFRREIRAQCKDISYTLFLALFFSEIIPSVLFNYLKASR
ncbi:MAG: hypothetical protein JJU37_01365, partial [Balneolaceae bacterium]|nr:hypothetical protein [Balneolaceae bacterium]